jgi:O-antigen ligase
MHSGRRLSGLGAICLGITVQLPLVRAAVAGTSQLISQSLNLVAPLTIAVAALLVLQVGLPARVVVIALSTLLAASMSLFGASLAGYSGDKATSLLFVVVPLIAAAPMILRSITSLRIFLLAVAMAGLFGMTVALFRENAVSVAVSRQVVFELNPLVTARAASAAFASAVTLLAFTDLPKSWRAPLAVTIVAGGYFTLASGSRGPTVGIVAALLIVTVSPWSKLRRRTSLNSGRSKGRRVSPLSLAVFAGLMVAAILLAPSAGVNRITTNAFDFGTRGPLYDAGVRGLLSSPLGVGLGDFQELTGAPAGARSYAHNMLLEVGSEMGALPLAMLVGFLVAAAIRCWRRRTAEGVLIAPLFAVFAANAAVSSDLVGNWALLAFAAVALVIRDESPLDDGAAMPHPCPEAIARS